MEVLCITSYDFFDTILSEKQCGFRKGFSVVKSLLPMIEKFRKLLDQVGTYGAFLTDFPRLLTGYIMSSL